MSAARQRNAGSKASEKAGAKNTALIQDSQGIPLLVYADSPEQEQEINTLRRENAATNDQAQTTLDVGVMTNLLLTGLQATSNLQQPELRNLVALVQFLLLPLSITPNKIPYIKLGWAAPFYPYIFRLQVVLAITAVYDLYNFGQLSIPAVFRVVLPALVAGGVFVQRRSEKEAEVRLVRLEKLKYNVKGA